MVHASGLADPRPSCCAKGLTLDELLRALATLDHQMHPLASYGRSPFWERPSRALPDPKGPGEYYE